MSFAPATHDDLAIALPREAGCRPVEKFLSEGLRALEVRITEVCRDLGRGLGGLSDELCRAVGTDGRGGRRWRPLLTLAAVEAFRGRQEDALDVAVAVELTHAASLVLDDLPCMDDSDLRRGQPATHRRVGSAGAILLSVSLLAEAVELLGRAPCGGGVLAEEWGRTVGLRGMAGGQAMDVAASGKPLRGAARRLHRAKSAALPAFALSSGARLAGAREPSREGLAAFGRSLGWAYQLLDDVEDVQEDSRLGRAPGGSRPLALSHRIMRRASRRLQEVPELGHDGVRLLLALARGIVVPELALEDRADLPKRARRS